MSSGGGESESGAPWGAAEFEALKAAAKRRPAPAHKEVDSERKARWKDIAADLNLATGGARTYRECHKVYQQWQKTRAAPAAVGATAAAAPTPAAAAAAATRPHRRTS